MREVAFRNMDHVYATRVALGVSDLTDPDSSKRVFDKMLLDQEMEQTEENRWVLGWASRASWEIYMCLLYAGVEQYRKVSADYPDIRLVPFEEWLQRHDDLVQHLRSVRHKLLHPLSDTDYLDGVGRIGVAARHAAPDLFLALEQLQNQLDDFLEHFRKCLQKSLGEEIGGLPGKEVVAYFRGRAKRLVPLIETSMSTEVQVSRRRTLDGLKAIEQSLGLDAGSDLTLTNAQLRRLGRLEQAEDQVGARLPRRPYHKSNDSVQTPLTPQLTTWALLASFGGQVAKLEEQFPNWVLRNRSGFLELLIRSLTIYNETHVALVSRFRAIFPSLPMEAIAQDEELWQEASSRSIPQESGAELDQAVLESMSYRVALGLLAEPLRIYSQLARQNSELVRQEIDVKNLDETLKVFKGLRNTIFHVPDSQADFFEADKFMAFAPISHGSYMDIVAGLVQFFQGFELPAEERGL